MASNTIGALVRFVRKDVLAGRRYLWIIVPFFMVYGVMVYITTSMYPIVCGVFVFFLSIAPALLETRYKSDILFCSLPLSRKQVVLGRYAGSVVIALFGLAVSFIYSIILDSLVGDHGVGIPLDSMAFILIMFTGMIILFLAAFYPFHFAFGFGKGIGAFGVVILATAALAIVVAAVIYVITDGTLRGFSPQLTIEHIRRVSNAMAAVNERLGSVGLALIATAIVASATALSIRISVALYGRRDF